MSERVERLVDGMVTVKAGIVAAEVDAVLFEAVHIAVIEAGTESAVVDIAVAIPKVNLSDIHPVGILNSFLVHDTPTLSDFAAAVTEPVSYTPLPLYQQSPLTKPLYHFFVLE
ncbi:uncharacterized protein FFUJ_14562 [Fusarium fujikuroi IMI 58289]|uniref:Uncharacterized protein n=1 Tax=Gibberella fujikuroi (strain CBS 195.34 / IMI 58289 / NRRL A-6831) TaxID=1279085 RepID=S0DYI0_GIBF5|nr:uncharacterized protein FFUJ_14562 [Fusarium fujikuroi IMI 58289]CCT67614.1 uncharacterized protein FFUJ_14562 [Fusarium fujikuroi IMI 58289]SCO21603.1 uncharacterized protein FFM5_12694 [Fusarium fujikuroi]SCO41875.1 uncharacterized protein FFMR_06562 [Fusarium fujikuroi]